MRYTNVAALILAVVLTAVAAGAQGFDFESVRADLFAGAAGDGAALEPCIGCHTGPR